MRVSVLLKTTFGVFTILRANTYSGLSGCTASQYLMKPSVIFLPSRMVSLESVISTMRAITPSSRLRVIQSSWPSGPPTNPSTVICTCSLSFRDAIKDVLVVGLTYASNQLSRNRHSRRSVDLQACCYDTDAHAF